MQIAIIHLTDIHFTEKSDFNSKIDPFCRAVISYTKGIQLIYFVLRGWADMLTKSMALLLSPQLN